PEDDSAEVAEWFNTKTDPEIAQAVAQAVAEARTPVSGAIDATRQYAPLSQQAQSPVVDYGQQAPRHGSQ
ncbi:MAG: SPFH domain-containing protein, partial [Mycobacterium sp.]